VKYDRRATMLNTSAGTADQSDNEDVDLSAEVRDKICDQQIRLNAKYALENPRMKKKVCSYVRFTATCDGMYETH
jgi:hypothetical protein